jgi:histone-lysine N-methyltransferase SETD8
LKGEVKGREDQYTALGLKDSYIFMLNTGAIDATESQHISRFINHSRLNFNLRPKLKSGALYLITSREIDVGEELLFDYGDRRPEVLEHLPWLKS